MPSMPLRPVVSEELKGTHVSTHVHTYRQNSAIIFDSIFVGHVFDDDEFFCHVTKSSCTPFLKT